MWRENKIKTKTHVSMTVKDPAGEEEQEKQTHSTARNTELECVASCEFQLLGSFCIEPSPYTPDTQG